MNERCLVGPQEVSPQYGGGGEGGGGGRGSRGGYREGRCGAGGCG
jgi:hypothetical protein